MARTREMLLSSGRQVTLAMPNMFAVLAKTGSVPSPAMASVLRLLEGAGSLEEQDLRQRLNGLREYFLGLYQIAALCLVTPKLRLDLKDGEELGEHEIGPDDLCFNDLYDIYFRFFFRDPIVVAPTTNGHAGSGDGADAAGAAGAGDDPDGTEKAVPDGDDVRPAPKRAGRS